MQSQPPPQLLPLPCRACTHELDQLHCRQYFRTPRTFSGHPPFVQKSPTAHLGLKVHTEAVPTCLKYARWPLCGETPRCQGDGLQPSYGDERCNDVSVAASNRALPPSVTQPWVGGAPSLGCAVLLLRAPPDSCAVTCMHQLGAENTRVPRVGARGLTFRLLLRPRRGPLAQPGECGVPAGEKCSARSVVGVYGAQSTICLQ